MSASAKIAAGGVHSALEVDLKRIPSQRLEGEKRIESGSRPQKILTSKQEKGYIIMPPDTQRSHDHKRIHVDLDSNLFTNSIRIFVRSGHGSLLSSNQLLYPTYTQ